MDLFVVNRYQPNEENEIPNANEDLLRQRLLKKVEERKKKGFDLEEAPPSVQNEWNDRPKRKRKKKKKEEIEERPLQDALEEKTVPEFVVLGKDERAIRKRAKRVLPHWLKNPSVVSVDLRHLTHTVDSIPELDDKLIQVLKSNKITHFFPVQAQVIPWLVKRVGAPEMYWPSDLCVSAPTGSGKTLAFVLPIIHALQHRLAPQVRALVVLPVHDLAKQVFNVFQTYSAHTTLKIALLSSANNLLEEQKKLVKKDNFGGSQCVVDVVVTTPGRLVDHLKNTPGFNLQHLRFLVVDEADRIMEDVQNDWLYHLNTHLGLHSGSSKSFQVPPLCLRTLQSQRRPPQKLLFSATLSQDPEKLQQFGLFQPKLFTSIVKQSNPTDMPGSDNERSDFVGKFTTPAELVEKYVVCSLANKPLVLFHLLETAGWGNLLCFTKSCDSAHRLAILLKAMGRGRIKVGEVSGKCLPSTRKKRLRLFEEGKLQVIVSSDALARGMDIANVEAVISYNVPAFIKNHVHRIGRAGRAGKQGTALTLLLPNQVYPFKRMLKIGGKTNVEEVAVSEEDVKKYADIYQTALLSLKKKLEIQKALTKRTINGKKGIRTAKSFKIKIKRRQNHENRKSSKVKN